MRVDIVQVDIIWVDIMWVGIIRVDIMRVDIKRVDINRTEAHRKWLQILTRVFHLRRHILRWQKRKEKKNRHSSRPSVT